MAKASFVRSSLLALLILLLYTSCINPTSGENTPNNEETIPPIRNKVYPDPKTIKKSKIG